MIKQILTSISRREWYFVLVMIFLIIIITTAPYVYGYLVTPPDRIYTGVSLQNIGDVFVYYSYIEQVKQDNFFFKDLFTSEDQVNINFNVYWLAVGFVAKLFNLSSPIVLQLFRVVFIPIFLITLYIFLSFFVQKKTHRYIGFIFLLFTSGLGYFFQGFFDGRMVFPDNHFQPGFVNHPIDFWVAESNNFLILISASAHFMASLTLIIWIFLSMYFALNYNKIKYSFIAGILALVLFQFHPYYVPLIFVILFCYSLVLFFYFKNSLFSLLKHLFILGFVSFPSILYHFLIVVYDPVLSIRSIQNLTLTPSITAVLAGYGLLFVFGVLGIIFILKNFKKTEIDEKKKYLFLITWFIINFLLLYFPISFQRRFTQGLQIPMVILSLISLIFIWRFTKKHYPRFIFRFFVNNKILLIFFFVIYFCMTNISNYITTFTFFNTQEYPFYLFQMSENRHEALNWLKSSGDKDLVVLTSLRNSVYVPAYTGMTSYYGHLHETLFSKSKSEWVKWFFQDNERDEKKIKFLSNNNIGYIVFDLEEKEFQGYLPDTKEYLTQVYENGNMTIFEVAD